MDDVNKIIKEIAELEAARRFPVALEAAQIAFRKYPQVKAIKIALANLLVICKEYEQAFSIYKKMNEQMLKANGKSDLNILIKLARCMFLLKQYEQADKLFSELLEIAVDHPDVMAGKAICLKHAEKIIESEQMMMRTLQINPKHKDALYALAEIKLTQNKTDEALVLLETNIRRPDVHGDSIDLWMSTLDKLDRNRYAQDVLQVLANDYPNIVEFIYGFAVLANRAGEITLARPAYLKALKISPLNARLYYELGVIERISGDLEKSQEMIGEALKIQPDNPAALRTFGSDLKYDYGDENYKRLNYVAAKFSEFKPIEQLHMHYALAKAQEDVGELDAAFRHYGIAGGKKRKLENYNEREAARLCQIIPQVVTKNNLAIAKDRGYESNVPVFILGMPRSGTSLMEQILSSHPEIFGAGELKYFAGVLENMGLGNDKGIRLRMGDKDPIFKYEDNVAWAVRGQRYVDKLKTLTDKPDYKRIVDKMPGNYNFVGLIHALLPNAKIIHSRRHPVETCLSCYRIHFAEGHQWSYNLRELGRHYKRYWALMQYWREAFPGVMYEAVYEENVADVEGSAKKLIDYLGLEWNDNCLNFYNTDRPVKTASVTQVRKPIYKTSTNRWRKYEKYLGPLLEELGDIVPQYEAEIAHLIEK
jgi:tetratricopeptide (TPR) repeat protein